MSDPVQVPTVEMAIGNTPLVRLQRLGADEAAARGNVLLAKLEGNNPAGSVKDRAAWGMIAGAERRGEIKPGDTLIEATSGNTGIALAMVAAVRGYRMILIMPDDLTVERRQAMTAYGSELILTPQELGGMEYARDLALQMQSDGKGLVLDQFSNDDNWRAHYDSTGPELWQQTQGRITHFVSAMGTTGTITGVSRYLKEQRDDVVIVGAVPSPGSRIAGIRKWEPEYVPSISRHALVDQTEEISEADAEATAVRLTREEGISCGVSSGGAAAIALRLSAQVRDATIVFVVCDRGDRYLSTGLFG